MLSVCFFIYLNRYWAGVSLWVMKPAVRSWSLPVEALQLKLKAWLLGRKRKSYSCGTWKLCVRCVSHESDLMCLGTVLTIGVFFFFIYRNCRLNRWAAAQKACLLSCFLTLFNSRCQRRRLVVSIVWKQNCLLLQMLWQSKSSSWWAYIRYNKLYIYNQQQQINLKSRSNRGLQKKYENVILLQDERSSEKDFLYLCYL